MLCTSCVLHAYYCNQLTPADGETAILHQRSCFRFHFHHNAYYQGCYDWTRKQFTGSQDRWQNCKCIFFLSKSFIFNVLFGYTLFYATGLIVKYQIIILLKIYTVQIHKAMSKKWYSRETGSFSMQQLVSLNAMNTVKVWRRNGEKQKDGLKGHLVSSL